MAAGVHGAPPGCLAAQQPFSLATHPRGCGRAVLATPAADFPRNAVPVSDETGAAAASAVPHAAGASGDTRIGASSGGGGAQVAPPTAGPDACTALAEFLVARELQPLFLRLERMWPTEPTSEHDGLLHVMELPRSLSSALGDVLHSELARLQLRDATIFQMDDCGCTLFSCRVFRVSDIAGFLLLHLVALSRHSGPCSVRVAHQHITPERVQWGPEVLATYLEDEVGLAFQFKSPVGIEAQRTWRERSKLPEKRRPTPAAQAEPSDTAAAPDVADEDAMAGVCRSSAGAAALSLIPLMQASRMRRVRRAAAM